MCPFWRSLKEEERQLNWPKYSKEEGAFGLKLKLKIVHSQNPSRPLILATEDDLPQTNIPGIGLVILATPILGIPVESVAMPVRSQMRLDLVLSFHLLQHVDKS